MDAISLAHPYICDVHTERIGGGGGGLPFSRPHLQAFTGGVAISCSIPVLGQTIFESIDLSLSSVFKTSRQGW